MFAVKMSHSGGIVNLFDFDLSLSKKIMNPSTYLNSLNIALELIVWQQTHPYHVNHKPEVKTECDWKKWGWEGEYDKMRVTPRSPNWSYICIQSSQVLPLYVSKYADFNSETAYS